jgi:hypothetical protein
MRRVVLRAASHARRFVYPETLRECAEVPVSVGYQRRSPAVYVGRIYFVGHGDVFCKDG